MPPNEGIPEDTTRSFLLAICVTKLTTSQHIITRTLALRCLLPAFALLSLLIARELSRRIGRFLGTAMSSWNAIKRVWRASPLTSMLSFRAREIVGDWGLIALPWAADAHCGPAAIMN